MWDPCTHRTVQAAGGGVGGLFSLRRKILRRTKPKTSLHWTWKRNRQCHDETMGECAGTCSLLYCSYNTSEKPSLVALRWQDEQRRGGKNVGKLWFMVGIIITRKQAQCRSNIHAIMLHLQHKKWMSAFNRIESNQIDLNCIFWVNLHENCFASNSTIIHRQMTNNTTKITNNLTQKCGTIYIFNGILGTKTWTGFPSKALKTDLLLSLDFSPLWGKACRGDFGLRVAPERRILFTLVTLTDLRLSSSGSALVVRCGSDVKL